MENKKNKNKKVQFCCEACCRRKSRQIELFDSFLNEENNLPSWYNQMKQLPQNRPSLYDPSTKKMNKVTEKAFKDEIRYTEPILYRQIIKVPSPSGKILQAYRQLPTPTPDVFQRIYQVKPERDLIDLFIWSPTTPPTKYTEQVVYSKPKGTIIRPHLIESIPTNYGNDPRMFIQNDFIYPQYNLNYMPNFGF